MKQYIIKRLLVLIPVFLGISVIIFILIYTSPGDPYSYMVESGLTPEDREVMLRNVGYYDPLPVKYVKWIENVASGNLGYSIRYAEPVTSVIARRIGNTAILSILTLFLSTIISVPLGVMSAAKQYSAFDYAASILCLVGISIPSFFLALGIVKLLAIDFQLFPVSGIQTTGTDYHGLRLFLDILWHMGLPLFVMVITHTASTMRYTRSAVLEILGQDYIRTARAKGLAERVVIYRHALKNALIPVTTLVTMSLGSLLSGTVLIETIFVWPGMGTLIYQAIGNRDYPLILAGTLLLSICILLANLLADILYAIIDPRIRFSQEGTR